MSHGFVDTAGGLAVLSDEEIFGARAHRRVKARRSDQPFGAAFRELKEGDIIGLDFGVLYKGYFGDAAITVPIGKIAPETETLLRVTEECLYRGIDKMVPENHLSDLSRAIQNHAESHGFSPR